MSTNIDQLLSDYPSKNWNANILSSNRSISFNTVSSHSFIRWNPIAVSSNAAIKATDVDANPVYPWDMGGLCNNQEIGFDFLLRYVIDRPNSRHRYWSRISANNSVGLDAFRTYKNKPWDFIAASSNTNMTSNAVLVEWPDKQWDIKALSSNRGITQDDIFKKRLEFHIPNLSTNPSLPTRYVVDNIDLDWNWVALSANPGTELIDVLDHSRLPWDINGLSINDNLTWDYVMTNRSANWNWHEVLAKKYVSLKNVDTDRDVIPLSNDAIVDALSLNPNVSRDWIDDNHKKINWDRMSGNTFGIQN